MPLLEQETRYWFVWVQVHLQELDSIYFPWNLRFEVNRSDPLHIIFFGSFSAWFQVCFQLEVHSEWNLFCFDLTKTVLLFLYCVYAKFWSSENHLDQEGGIALTPVLKTLTSLTSIDLRSVLVNFSLPALVDLHASSASIWWSVWLQGSRLWRCYLAYHFRHFTKGDFYLGVGWRCDTKHWFEWEGHSWPQWQSAPWSLSSWCSAAIGKDDFGYF